jgi:8-oxo-dGTP diphosphatase
MVAVTLVRAAGGVPWRIAGDALEVALVHRPRYGDWTLPKGKLEAREHPLRAAVREVREETGLSCVPQVRLPTITYLTGEPDVEKSVDFWSMRVARDHGREPDHEIDDVRWVPLRAAGGVLTYKHDRGVLAAFARLPRITAEVALVRHAQAGARRNWHGPDELRPLDPVGVRQAKELSGLLELLAPQRVRSATPVRCRDTVAPLAASLGLDVTVDPVFNENAPGGVPDGLSALKALAEAGGASVVCGQGHSIPLLVAAARPQNATADHGFDTPKATGWLLAWSGPLLASAGALRPSDL